MPSVALLLTSTTKLRVRSLLTGRTLSRKVSVLLAASYLKSTLAPLAPLPVSFSATPGLLLLHTAEPVT